MVITYYGPRAISGGTTYGKQGMGSANKGTAYGYRVKRGAGNLYDRLIRNHLVFTLEAGISGQVGMSKVLSHDGDRILV